VQPSPLAPVTGHRRVLGVIGVVVGAAGVLFGLLLLLGGILEASHAPNYKSSQGQSTGSGIGVAIFGVVLTVGFVVLTMSCEHHLRRHQSAARAWVAPHAPPGQGSGAPGTGPPGPAAATPVPALARRTKTKRYSPVTLIVLSLILTAVTGVCLFGVIVSYHDGQRSSQVQHHGIHATTTVVSVHNTYTTSRSGNYYTATMLVSLANPVDSHATSTVHYPGRLHDQAGQTVQVLLDPKNPGYAELPGSPNTPSRGWILVLVALFIVASAALLFWRGTYRVLRHRRRSNSLPG